MLLPPRARLTAYADSGPDVLLQDRMLVLRAPGQGACDEWAMHLQGKIFEMRSTDFASSIGDEDTRFWAETVKVQPKRRCVGAIDVGAACAHAEVCTCAHLHNNHTAEESERERKTYARAHVCTRPPPHTDRQTRAHAQPGNLKEQEFALCKVYKDSEEWQHVLKLFAQSMPPASLVRCMRVQVLAHGARCRRAHYVCALAVCLHIVREHGTGAHIPCTHTTQSVNA